VTKGLEGIIIKQIACGGEHTLAIAEDGRLFSWGWNEHGQLGLQDIEDKLIPTQVTLDTRLKQIVGGKYGHSLALTG
jgi:alpha-tubulin suppressor-like RCC1 family protein